MIYLPYFTDNYTPDSCQLQYVTVKTPQIEKNAAGKLTAFFLWLLLTKMFYSSGIISACV